MNPLDLPLLTLGAGLVLVVLLAAGYRARRAWLDHRHTQRAILARLTHAQLEKDMNRARRRALAKRYLRK